MRVLREVEGQHERFCSRVLDLHSTVRQRRRMEGVNLLPRLVWRDPGFLAAHREWSPWYMDGVEMLIVAIAFQQFYRLDLKRQWWRLLLAVLLFAGIKWLLLAGFAWLLVRLVMAQLA